MKNKKAFPIEIDLEGLKKYYDEKVVRKLGDMADRFENPLLKRDPILYTVYVKSYGPFQVALTVLESGNINGEYYMTKGHRHKKKREEMYILTRGKGKLLIQGKKAEAYEMKKNKIYTIPGKAGHRTINTGKGKMEFLSIYSTDSGHDYNFRFKKRFFKSP